MKPKNTWKRYVLNILILFSSVIFVGGSHSVVAAQISGFVWLDNNADGLQSNDEPGFAQTVPNFGAPNIALYPTGSTELIEFILLDENSNGHYVFENVPNGNYYVCVSNEFLVLGLSVTTPNAGDDAIDSDFDFSPCSYGIEVSGSQLVQRDLGLTGADDPADPADPNTNNLISGIVWLDNNGDGLRNNNESVFAQTVAGFGAPNISIYLSGSIEPLAISSLDENSNGRYQFEVADGDYYICVSNEFRVLGLVPTIQNAGDDAIDSDFDASPCSYDISVTEPDTPQRDLGLVGDSIVPDDPSDPNTSNQISGFVWLDNNANGLQDTGESGFAQTVPEVGFMTVALYPEGSTEFFEVAFLDEDSNGHYLFEDVPAGNYYICTNTVFQLLGLSVTTPNVGDDSIDSDFDFSPCSYDISVSGGQVVKRDLGLAGEFTDGDTGHQISGIVWLDSNQNTRFDEDESGVVALAGIYALPEKVGSFVKHIVTDENGLYEFTNLQPGEYRVVVSGSSVITSASDIDSSVSIDFPVDKIPDGIIKVDGASCTLLDAIESIVLLEQIGGCVSTNPFSGGIAIVLETGGEHPKARAGRRSSRIFINIYGNGSSIAEFSSTPADSNIHGAQVLFTNVVLDSVYNGNSRLAFDHVDIGNISFNHDADNVRFSHSRIGSIGGSAGSPPRIDISSSIVTGDALINGQVVSSTIEGTLSPFVFGRTTIKNSSVNKIAMPRFRRTDGSFTTGLREIENSTIGDIFINDIMTFGTLNIGEECFDEENILDPLCLLI
jgi:hypothetical protein